MIEALDAGGRAKPPGVLPPGVPTGVLPPGVLSPAFLAPGVDVPGGIQQPTRCKGHLAHKKQRLPRTLQKDYA